MTAGPRRIPGVSRQLELLTDGIGAALNELGVAVYVFDREGTFCWLNKRAVDLVGDVVGQKFTTLVAPDQVHLARRQFARKLIGAVERTDFSLTVLAPQGGRLTLRVTSAPLREDGEIVGVLALAIDHHLEEAYAATDQKARRVDPLTPRQHEVLRLLARGLGTDEIAADLGVAQETARNHIRAILRKLEVHSRLEAVAVGHERGLLEPAQVDPRGS
jgi:PAS domain S-box-containing protein